MDSCEPEMINVHKDNFHSNAMKPSSIRQNDVTNSQTVCNCDYNSTQGVCELHMYDEDDDEDGIETNNNHIFEADDLDIVVDEFESNTKDFKRRSSSGSDPDSFGVANNHAVDDCNLSAIYQGEWSIDRTAYWNDDSDSVTPSSLEGALQQDTASIMSFDSSMTTGSAMNEMSSSSDQCNAKADVVYTLLSMLQTHDKMEVSEKLLAMSNSRENCIAMIESGCLPLLVQLLHERNERQTANRHTTELRKRASQILRNIVYSQPDDKKGRREARVLRLLEQVRDYCDFLRAAHYEVIENENVKCTEQQLGPTVAALMKLSFDEEHRHAMCLLGALQAIAELIEYDQEVHGCTNDQYCIMIRRYAGMALTNLTFGDGTNKALLCSMRPFMQSLVAQLYSPSEELRQVSASVLRNLSWRADFESKRMLREVGAVTTLMKAAMEAMKESTLKSILSALWNLSAHCSENKADICRIDGALGFLVSTLSFKSSSKNLAVVENGGGILRNVSSHIAIQNDHRITLRKHNCLQILLHHLKSPSLTVVSNACGTLWNLSARNAQDQRTLWELGAVGMLKKLVNSKHKMISMGSSAALKNLLSAMPPGMGSGLGIPLNEYNSGMPSLHVRKQKVLSTEIDQTLSETYDNTDSPKSSPTYRKKSLSTESRRPHSAPVQRQGIPQRVSNKAHSIANTQVGSSPEKQMMETAGIQKYGSPTRSPRHNFPQADHISSIPHSSGAKQKSGSFNDSQSRSIRGSFSPSPRVGSPSNMRPYSYPGRKEKSNINQEMGSRSLHVGSSLARPHEIRSRSPSLVYARKLNETYSNLAHQITNIKFDEPDCQEQPVNYSLKYSEESAHGFSKTGADSKIPLPKLSGYSDSCRPSNIVPPMCIKDSHHQHGHVPKVTMRKSKNISHDTSNAYSHYTETDLDFDQVVDYSQKYQEREGREDDLQRRLSRSRLPYSRGPPKTVNSSKLSGNFEDTVKVYCTEDTPVNFSMSSSLTDLCDVDGMSVQPQLSSPPHPDGSVSTKERSSRNRTMDFDDKTISVPKDKEGKSGICVETPLMFSRCSSLGSLSSFDQPSIHDDRSSVSDFSRMASGVVSPSELPDSPSETMPPSPRRKKQASVAFGETQDRPDLLHEQPVSGGPAGKMSNEPFDEVHNTYMVEGTPVHFSTASSLSSLSIENDQEHCKAFLAKDLHHNNLVNGKSPLNSDVRCNVQPEQEIKNFAKHCQEKVPETSTFSTAVQSATPTQKNNVETRNLFNKPISTENLCNVPCGNNADYSYNYRLMAIRHMKSCSSFPDDTVKVYQTEGTPNLSHSASLSDLSNLSFGADKNACERSLEDSCEESEGSCDDTANIQSVASKPLAGLRASPVNTVSSKESNLRRTHLGYDQNVDRNISASANNSLNQSNGGHSFDEDELLLKCIKAGMPKPKKKSNSTFPEQACDKNVTIQSKRYGAEDAHMRNTSYAPHVDEVQDPAVTSKDAFAPGAHGNFLDEDPSSQLIEGTPVCFSRNSSLSSLSIESCDGVSPDKIVLQEYVRPNMPGSETSIPKPRNKADQITEHNYHSATNSERKITNRSTEQLVVESPKKSSAQNNDNSLVESDELEKTALYEKTLLRECIELGLPKRRVAADSSKQLHKHDTEYSAVPLNATRPAEWFYSSEKAQVNAESRSSCAEQYTFDKVSNKQLYDHARSPQKMTRHTDVQPPIQDKNSVKFLRSECEEGTLPALEKTLLERCVLSGKQALINDNNFLSSNVDTSKSIPEKSTLENLSSPPTRQGKWFSQAQSNILSLPPDSVSPLANSSMVVSRQDDCMSSKVDDSKVRKLQMQEKNNLMRKTDFSDLTPHEKSLLEKCISSGMPKKCEKDRDTNLFRRSPKLNVKKLSHVNSSPQMHVEELLCDDQTVDLTIAEKELLQRCISSGMPKKRSRTHSNPNSMRRSNVECSPKHLVQSPLIQSSQSSSSISHEGLLRPSEEVLLRQCILSGMQRSSEGKVVTQQKSLPFVVSSTTDVDPKCINLSKSTPTATSRKENERLEPCETSLQSLSDDLTSEENALLQKCILSGMPKPKKTTQVNQDHKKLKFKVSPDNIPSTESYPNHCNSGLPEKYLTPSETNDESFSEMTFLHLNTKQAADLLPLTTTANGTEVTSGTNKYQQSIDIETAQGLTTANISDHLGMDNACSDVRNLPVDLSREAQKLTEDMMEAIVDSTEDMTVSTLSCLSDIDNITPPSAMVEFGSISLTNSGFGDELKLSKNGKLGTTQKNSLLKDLQLSKLGSDPNLSELKCKMTDSTLSLSMKSSSSTDILENINPPSVLDDISLTASTGSLNSLQSNILDSKSQEEAHIYTSEDSSMNERMCEAAAMVQMYTKEFSNITGIKNTNNPEWNSIIAPAVCAAKDIFEDITEPACDTIASDIEFVDELPCDDEDPGSETLLGPQLSSLNKDEQGDGSTENLTLTLTEEPPGRSQHQKSEVTEDAFDVLRENADLILNTLKKVHISESSDFGCLTANDMLEDETLSLVSNESDDDSLSPDGVFVDKQASLKSPGNFFKSKNAVTKQSDNIAAFNQAPTKKGHSQIPSSLPSLAAAPGHRKFGFKMVTPAKNSHIISDHTTSKAVESSNSVCSDVPTSTMQQQPITQEDPLPQKSTETVFDSRTFTRRKPSNHGNIPSITHQPHKEAIAKALKSPTYSSRESIESCSTSNSLSSLSSGDTSSNKSVEKRNIPSKIGSIWKSSPKMRSKSSIDCARNKNVTLVKQHTTGGDRERSLSPSLQRTHSQTSSPQTLSRSSTEERIAANQDVHRSLKRPTTLTLSKRNELPKSNKAESPSPVAEITKNMVSPTLTSPMSQSRSNLPVLKSMIPMSSKIGTGDRKSKVEQSADPSCTKPKACIVTMV